MKLFSALPFLAVALLPVVCGAQGLVLDPARQQAVIDKTIDLVNANYVYPDRAKAVETTLRGNVQAGKYRDLLKPDDFLEAVNRDMQAAGKDRHLRIVHNPRIVAQLKQEAAGSEEVSPEYVEMLRESNYRLRRAESLDGNVGYFKFDNFVELRYVRDAFVGAMNFLHDSSALILDLTDNGGGASETSDLLVSYFLPEGTRTGESWNRATNETTVSTVRRPPGVKPMLDTPLYILVGERTASAAEAVAYTLQQAGRAVIVGSRTKGMANPGVQIPIDDALFVIVPTILNRNSVSGTNWEGTGVIPDVAAEPRDVLNAAMAAALKNLGERKTDPKARSALLFAAEPYDVLLSPESPPPGFLDACLGEYEDGTRIEEADGSLWFRKGETNRRLSYMRDLTFTVEGRRDYRLRFPFEHGKVTRCEVLWFDDTSDTSEKTR